ncbi:hypothetical protein BU15DRAFT_83332 [Melanogaster broomeanus]|nr:hypothetical protein BU15DRAFT_83332 [Melanogaster broomeanus]
MATYTSFLDAIVSELAEFKDKQAQGVAREGVRENDLREWSAQKELETAQSDGDAGKLF